MKLLPHELKDAGSSGLRDAYTPSDHILCGPCEGCRRDLIWEAWVCAETLFVCYTASQCVDISVRGKYQQAGQGWRVVLLAFMGSCECQWMLVLWDEWQSISSCTPVFSSLWPYSADKWRWSECVRQMIQGVWYSSLDVGINIGCWNNMRTILVIVSNEVRLRLDPSSSVSTCLVHIKTKMWAAHEHHWSIHFTLTGPLCGHNRPSCQQQRGQTVSTSLNDSRHLLNKQLYIRLYKEYTENRQRCFYDTESLDQS